MSSMKRLVLLGSLTALLGISAQASSIFGYTNGTQTRQLSVTTTDGLFNFDATDSGWYDSTGMHGSSNENYITTSPDDGLADYNNFFTFLLSGITGGIQSATLNLSVPSDPGSITGSGTYSLWDVSTPIAALTAGGAGLTAIHNDLSSGTLFGSRAFSTADIGTLFSVNLNSAALAAIGAGGAFAIGGSVGDVAAAPEPGTMLLLGAGLTLIGVFRRKQLGARS